jgi:hypothetical protein
MLQNTFKKRIAFYTCLINDYDYLFEPDKDLREFYDFYLLTNNKYYKSKFWNIIYVKKKYNNVYTNRYYKILLHKKILRYEYSVYFDSNIIIKSSIYLLIKNFIKSKKLIGLFKHSSRNNVNEEIQENYLLKKITKKSRSSIINFYKKKKYFSNNDLTENGIIFRNHQNIRLKSLMSLWWKTSRKFFARDQIILPYCLWIKKVTPKIFNVNIWRERIYFLIIPHKKKIFYHKSLIRLLIFIKEYLKINT